MPSPWNAKRVLVTGGLGFLGSNLALRLVDLGATVTIADALIQSHGGDRRNVASAQDRLRVEISDLRDANATRALVVDQEVVFHLAGQVSHGDSMRDPELDLGVNCVSTINLVEACRKLNPGAKLVYSSTRQVYGRPRRLPVDEDHPTVPVDVNGINKLAAEYYHLLYHHTYDLRSVVLRLTNCYGPRQQIKNDRQGVAGILIRRAMLGQRIQIWGDGAQRRDFNHVDDVVDALLLAATTPACEGQVLNLGADEHWSLNEFVGFLREHCTFEIERMPFPADRKLIDIGDYYGDYTRFRTLTGWRPRIGLSDGLARSIAFFRAHADIYL